MNRHPAQFYKTDVKDTLEALFSRSSIVEWGGCVSAKDIDHANRVLAAKRQGLDSADLLIRGFQIVAVK